MIVRRQALVDRPDHHVFDLIEAAEHYPRFLPWCAGATVTARTADEVSADLQVRWGGVRLDFGTRNPKRRPGWMAIHLTRGPFRRFYGEWRLAPLGDDGCRVDFLLDYEFDSALMTRLGGPVLKHIADTIVDAFVARAQSQPLIAAAMPLPPQPAA